MSGPEGNQPKGFAPRGGVDRPSRREVHSLVEASGLRFDDDFDDLVGLYEGDRLVACGARAGYVLKMLAIAPSHQGTDVLGELVTKLRLSALAAGQDTVFVFTLPQNAASFQALNFHLLVAPGQAALLEHGPGLEAYLAEHASEITPGRNGAVVINGNPFSLGHLHLVETAARQVERLYLFVVREDRSVFPFDVRFHLAKEATGHLPNVTVLDTSRYVVSAGTFPSYFLKRLDAAAETQMQADLHLFAQRLAPRFHIATRFVGEEPLCPTTAAYNRLMAEVLESHGLQWVEVPRIQVSGLPISATRVRRAFADQAFETLRSLVPPVTLAYLQSKAACPVAERLRTQREGT